MDFMKFQRNLKFQEPQASKWESSSVNVWSLQSQATHGANFINISVSLTKIFFCLKISIQLADWVDFKFRPVLRFKKGNKAFYIFWSNLITDIIYLVIFSLFFSLIIICSLIAQPDACNKIFVDFFQPKIIWTPFLTPSLLKTSRKNNTVRLRFLHTVFYILYVTYKTWKIYPLSKKDFFLFS